MCGLAGRFHPLALPEAPGWSARAGMLLAHRGPDGEGCYRDVRCELVHRRLALLDLTPTGHQPMANEDGSVLVVFNGEIYNHRDLRRRLQAAGHRFRGTADTEVLVHLFEEHGDGLVDHLRGIFAFAVYDARARRLLLARDRFGVKPLFFAQLSGQWVFASEMKAITALPGFRPTLDRQACWDYLGLGYVPEPATGFREIAALPAGTTLAVDGSGARMRTWHRIAAGGDRPRSIEHAADAAGQRLVEAVAGQSAADVPVAALLSGGIDSSLIVAARRRATGAGTATFSMRFPDRRHDESALARAVADHCAAAHQVVDAGPRAVAPEQLLALLQHFDQPFADTSCFPTYWVSAAVRERGIICTLSGDGGDEAFGGYARFWRANRLAMLMRLPRPLRLAIGAAGRTLTRGTRDLGRQVARAVRLADAGGDDAAILLAGLASYLAESQKASLLRPGAADGLLPTHRLFDGYRPRGTRDLEELSRRMTETLFAVSLPSDMLRKVDMMSMRAGIEVRVPLLDEDLVTLGLSLPHRLKTDGRAGKLVLRALARRWLPRRVARHPKHGFGVPLDVMAPRRFHEALHDLLESPRARIAGFMDRPTVADWLAALGCAGLAGRPAGGGAVSRGGVAQRVVMLVSLELWMRDHGLTW